MRPGNPLRAVVLGVAVLVCSLFLSLQPAHADWWEGYVGGSNFGPDYFAAACSDMHHIYPGSGTCAAVGFGYNQGYPVTFEVTGLWGTLRVYGYSANRCAIGEVPVMTGCSTMVNYQGCKPSSGSPDTNGNEAVGEPCDIASGNLFETATDFTTVGQNPLTSRRYYNSNLNFGASPPTSYTSSHSALYSRFGYGWHSEYDRFLAPNSTTITSATVINAIRADGTSVHFAKSGSNYVVLYWNTSTGSWSNSTDPQHSIIIKLTNDGTYWYVTDDRNTVDKYSNTGQLLTVTYLNGYQQSFTYDSSGNNTVVSDSFGRSLTFAYLANGLVSSVTDAASNVTQYSYVDRSGVSPPPASSSTGMWALQKVTYPDSTAITYSYTDPNPINYFALTGITDEDGNAYAAWTYDSTTGRMTSSQLAGGANQVTITYNDTAHTRTVTNALGKQVIYSLTAYQGLYQTTSAAGQASTHTPASTESYTYDSNGYMQLATSGEGRETHYVHNSIGQETSRTDGYGSSVARTISTTWDATYFLPDVITEPNLTFNFTYTSGLLTQLKETDTTTQSIPYSTNGQTRIWNYTYYSGGLLHTAEGPLGSGDTVTYAYNTNGFISSITNQLSQVTTISSWNVWGEPLTSVDPNGITTNYTYDLRARLKSVTVNPGASQAVTSFTYDNAGNLTNITRPDGSSLTYGYDAAHRLTSITNGLGESITYTLDAMGDRTATVVKSSTSTITKQQTATFDELARLLQAIGASSQTTAFGYDKDNNVTSVTDPRSKLYQFAFDAIERVMQKTDPDSYTTGVGYNGNDQVTSVTDARSLATGYVRDGFGDIIQTTSPDTGATVSWFDAHGNVIKTVDARSVETDFTYDDLNRVLTKTFPADSAENVTYTYDSTSGGNDGIGRLTSVADQSGSTALVYDPLGHIISDTRVVGGSTNPTAYTYDPAGNILTETYPSGRVVTYTRDAMGRISGITTSQGTGYPTVTVASSVSYEPFGPFAGLTFGNGVVSSLSYDQDYELTGINSANGSTVIQNLTYAYDPSSNITSITDGVNSARSQTFTYDDLNRVWTASGLYGSQSYTYDGVGNRLTFVAGSNTSAYAYSPTANQISTITTGSNVRGFTYQPSGQVSQDVRDPSDTYAFTINNDGRNASASDNSSTVGSYLYNGFEQRVQKIAGGATTDLVYDRFGHLLEEVNDSTGAAIREYLWMDDMPVAMVDDTGASPVLYYIHTDQLGSPQKITDASLNVDWDGAFDPFGNVASLTGSLTNNLRFPGQYADAETALNQNWFRDYDPTIGRYIQSDPIGLFGGMNTYNYVDGDPVIFRDPSGQFLPLLGIAIAIGGFAGGITDLLNADECENPAAAFFRGFISGAIGTATGLAVGLATKNPWLAGAYGAGAANIADQYLAGTSDPGSFLFSTGTGLLTGPISEGLFPARGFQPNLLTPRSLSNFGPNSRALTSQEAFNATAGAFSGVAYSQATNAGKKPCCQKQ